MEFDNRFSQTRSYNDDGTLATISFSGAPIGDLSYGWDANQNKTSEAIGGVMSGYGFTASYDAEDRLIGWERSDTSLGQSWDLSPVGDWNSITQNAAVQNRSHGPVHEILTAASQSVQHDVKGNMTLIPPALRPGSDPLKLKWDFDNRLKAADTDNDGVDDVFYRWDALGRRVGRDDGTNHTIYFQDGQQTLADYAAAGSPSYIYVYGSYIDEVVRRSGGSGVRYYHRNQQYSITALTDGGGSIVERYAYTAYGQVTFADASGTVQAASASNNRFTFTGREWDAGLSLYHYRARMYDPVAGRFVSRDPIKYTGGLHLYAYAFEIPTVNIDPLGLIPPWDFGPGVPPIPWPDRPTLPGAPALPAAPGTPGGAGNGIYAFFAELLPCGSISFSYEFSISTTGGVPVPQFVLRALEVFGVPPLPPPGTVGGGTFPCLPCTRCCIDSVITTNFTLTVTAFYSTTRVTPNIPISMNASTTTVVSTGSCVDVGDPCPPVVSPPPINLPPLVIDTGIDVA